MKYVLHVGLPKTASTSLQENVFPHLPDIALSLRTEEGWAKTLAAVRYVGAQARALPQGEDAYLRKIREKFRSLEVGKVGAQTVLISDELIIGGHPDGVGTIIRRLQAVCQNARVVIILRRPLDFLRSYYRQEFTNYIAQLGVGQTAILPKVKTFTSFVRGCLDADPNGHVGFLRYDEIVSTLYECYGRSNVLVMAYEKLKEDERLFLKTLLSFIGTEFGSRLRLGNENVSADKFTGMMASAKAAGLTPEQLENLETAYNALELESDVAYRLERFVQTHIRGRYWDEFPYSPLSSL